MLILLSFISLIINCFISMYYIFVKGYKKHKFKDKIINFDNKTVYFHPCSFIFFISVYGSNL